ncbi:probable metal-nicotianamine transporter YSL17 [Phragmites australis]|uniref:probable metal-nicotianamine transporter YSL17 n=1 Tax=Phragmites australis TaxID=29695 RepID=UPI002D784333|nr:probable metal-nicotianamine transporter YSL17 [Phragmites australis]
MEPPAYDDQEVREEEAGPSMERVFEGEPVPSRSETITARSAAVSVVLGTTLSVVGVKLSLTSGFLPSLTIPAGLLGFFLSRAWVRLFDGCEAAQLPFTRQENTVIMTFVVACSSIAYSGGFGSHILAMSRNAAEGGAGSGGRNVEEPNVGRLVAFLFLTSFAGLFAIMPFRNSLIIRHHLTFPSGMATAHLINTIHTPQGAKQASKQVSVLFKTFGGTIAWSLFQWFFAAGADCGFQAFPTFGLAAYRRGFYFDFSMTNIGVGMLSPYKITISVLVGSLVSWGIMWPYIETKEGSWYPRDLDDDSLSGINAYRVFIGISMVLADGLFHLLCILLRTVCVMHRRRHTQRQAAQPFLCVGVDDRPAPRSFDDRRRAQVFLRDRVFDPAAVAGYVALSVVSIVVIPQLYPQLRHHHVAFAYVVAPVFAFCNAYGTGITDMNVATTYGKIAMLVFGSWVGLENGGVVAGLVACGVVVSAIATATDLMQDFRTGYLTLTSPHTVLISQVAGTALGCVINPVVFWAFYKVYNDGAGAVPYAKVYRGIAMLGVGHDGLPRHSLLLCKTFFALALALSVLREVSSRRRWRVGRYVPSTIAVAVAFFVSPKMAVGMCTGSTVMYLWRRFDGDAMRVLSPAMAAGLICGDGFGSLLLSVLTLFKARAPICIKFLSRDVNVRLDAFLATLPTS